MTGADRFLLTYRVETPMTTSNLSLERFLVSRQITKAREKLVPSPHTPDCYCGGSSTSFSYSWDFPFRQYTSSTSRWHRDHSDCWAQCTLLAGLFSSEWPTPPSKPLACSWRGPSWFLWGTAVANINVWDEGTALHVLSVHLGSRSCHREGVKGSSTKCLFFEHSCFTLAISPMLWLVGNGFVGSAASLFPALLCPGPECYKTRWLPPAKSLEMPH